MIYQVAAEAEHCRPSDGGGWHPEEQELSTILNITHQKHHVGYSEFFKYFLEHCFLCRPAVPLCRRKLELSPVTFTFSVGRSDRSARSHPQSRLDLIHTQLDLICTWLNLTNTRLYLIQTRQDLIHTRKDLIQNRLVLIHTRLDLIHTWLDLIHTRLDIIHFG